MAATTVPAKKSFFSYYGQRSICSADERTQLPVTPEELEFTAEMEMVTIVPNFSLEGKSSLFCLGGNYGPFLPNTPVTVPLWLALMLHKRNKCRIQPPEWMSADNLQSVLDEEASQPGYFMPLPFYYVEIARSLFAFNPVDTFGSDKKFSEVRSLLEKIRKVRYHKIESGLKKVEGAVTVKLNNLSATECNTIRLLFKGTLDHFHQINKNVQAWTEQSMANTMATPL